MNITGRDLLDVRFADEVEQLLRNWEADPSHLELELTENTVLTDPAEALETSQPYVSNQLACLRWCGLVTTRREHRTIYYRLADERVGQILSLAQYLLGDNAEHVAACKIVDSRRC